ncbi:MAG: hypothetical protein HPY53_11255 [Brevinematales bacterium]|nr:hypothetical protein [Brevinematales bacterium]
MFNPKTLREFRFSFQNAVAALESQYNVKVELGNIKYSENEFRSQMTVTSVNNGVKVISEHDIIENRRENSVASA